MPRYVAFLRGVSPQNANMAELKRSFEKQGFANVRTVLSSGNVVFDAKAASEAALERQAQACMQAELGRGFVTIVRRADHLHALLQTDPYAAFALPPGAKRVVTFLREPPRSTVALPIESDGARVLCLVGREVFTVYVPSAKGPVFMSLIEKAFGTEVTTRTWGTIEKCAAA